MIIYLQICVEKVAMMPPKVENVHTLTPKQQLYVYILEKHSLVCSRADRYRDFILVKHCF